MKAKLPDNFIQKKSLFWLVILILTLLRITWLYITEIELYGDEAQYWIWSKNLDFGYYSKPPILSYIIYLSTSLFGDAEASVRISSALIHLLVSYVVYRISLMFVADKIAALWCALAYATLPSVFLSSALISTDPAFMLLWALSFLFYLKAMKNDYTRDWLLMGALVGIGLLTKYSMGVFVLCMFCHMLIIKKFKTTLLNYKLWFAGSVSLLLFCPNLIWNYQNDFPSLSHTYDLSQGRVDERFTLKNPVLFLLGQLGMIGPILFVAFALSIQKGKKELICFSLPFIVFITLLAFYSRAHANWAAPAYVTATILAVHYLYQRGREFWLKFSMILHLSIGVFMMCYIAVIVNFEVTLNRFDDPLKRITGNYEMTVQLTSFIDEDGYCYLAFDDRKTLAAFEYNLREHKCKFLKWNPTQVVKDHFDLTTDLNEFIGEDIYFVSTAVNYDEMARYFKSIHYVTTLVYNPYDGQYKSLQVYKMKRFKGYGDE